MPCKVHAIVLAIVAAALPCAGKAQTSPVLPDAPSQTQQDANRSANQDARQQEHVEAEQQVKQEEHQRILSVLPNVETVISGEAVPLSPGQKTDLALHSVFEPFNAVGAAFAAGYEEVAGIHRGFGWGPAGYFKRVGAAGADLFDSTMLSGAVFPILLRQDPRYFRRGKGSGASRGKAALVGAFVCRGDNGRRQPNYSNMLGNLTSGAISNAYYPRADRGAAQTFEDAGFSLAFGALGNIALEFSPDINNWWAARKNRKAIISRA
jgi:hypothetical protein